MPSTRKYSELTDPIEADAVRAARLRAATLAALDEHREYQLAELRRALGVTQAELAQLIGRSQSAVSQLETGEIGLSVDLLRAIVEQLGGHLEITAIFDDQRVNLAA